METFNKYGFIQDLNDFLTNEIENGNDTDINTLIYEYIDNECIYYSDCWDICKTLNANDFTAFDMECNTINQLAYCALWELVNEKLNISELETLYEEKFNQ
jgi:hypothetical protein